MPEAMIIAALLALGGTVCIVAAHIKTMSSRPRRQIREEMLDTYAYRQRLGPK